MKKVWFENSILFLQCVGPFGVGRKKRSPLFLNSNQVSRIKHCLHIALTKMQVHQRFEVDFLILFDSLPFIGRELEIVVMLL